MRSKRHIFQRDLFPIFSNTPIKGATCKNWPPVEFITQKTRKCTAIPSHSVDNEVKILTCSSFNLIRVQTNTTSSVFSCNSTTLLVTSTSCERFFILQSKASQFRWRQSCSVAALAFMGHLLWLASKAWDCKHMPFCCNSRIVTGLIYLVLWDSVSPTTAVLPWKSNAFWLLVHKFNTLPNMNY